MSKTSNLNRVDGRAKVTGAATYSAEYKTPGVLYACLVGATIAKGRIKSLETKKAEWAPGVQAVITHVNVNKPAGYSKPKDPSNLGQPLQILNDDTIKFYDQPIAIVVADTFERMRYAAGLIKAEYVKEDHQTDLNKSIDKAKMPKGERSKDYLRGNAKAYKDAEVSIEAEYVLPADVHNPMELANIIASGKMINPCFTLKARG